MLHPHLKELDFLAVGCVSHQGGPLRLLEKCTKNPALKFTNTNFVSMFIRDAKYILQSCSTSKSLRGGATQKFHPVVWGYLT